MAPPMTPPRSLRPTRCRTAGAIYVGNGTCRLASDVTITHAMEIAPGGMLYPDIGKTVTINGPLAAGDYQIFTGSGLIRGTPKTPEIMVDWWGAKNDGTNAVATLAAVQAAKDHIAASANPNAWMTFSHGTYDFGISGVTKAHSNRCPRIRGAGKDATTITLSPSDE